MSLRIPFSLADIVFGGTFGFAVLIVVTAWAHRLKESKVLLPAIFVKLLATLVYGLVAVYYYGGVADSIAYHEFGVEYADIIRSDLRNGASDYLSTDPFFGTSGYSTSRVISFSGLIHFILFDSFTASSFVFALIGFVGQVLLYRTFVAQYPDRRIRNWWRLGILFFPSLTFWSSGILKDPLGIFGLGCVIWGVHQLLNRLYKRSLVWLALGLYVLFLFRPQILPVIALAIAPWVLKAWRAQGVQVRRALARSPSARVIPILLATLCVMGLLLIWRVLPNYSLAELPRTLIVDQSSLYELYGVGTPITRDASWMGLIKAGPAALVLALFRPFVWEVSGPLMLLSALENLLLLLLVVRALFSILRDTSILTRALAGPMFLTSAIFVLLLGAAVGVSTPNVGSISRYRMPLIPFFVAVLSILEYYRLERRTSVSKDILPALARS